jgi:ubiquinone/menaquinone biosynthesis C-methylase UbiE
VQRVFDPNEPELMDRPQPVSAELEDDLRSLVSLNRWFGSHRLLRRFLAMWLAEGAQYRVLDLATGAGDLPRIMAGWARQRGIKLQIDAVDANPSTLEIARKASTEFPEITFVRDNALTYAPAETYDLVCCSLALHHFSEADAVRLLRQCRELSQRYVLVADLERSRGTLFAIRALTTLIYRAPMTRADALTSARRAFSFDEFRALAEEAGWHDFGHARFLFCRQAIWLDMLTGGDIPLDDAMPCPI